MAVRLVCFDWGGVILRICRSFRQAVLAAGLPVDGRALDPELPRRRHELAGLYQTGRLGEEEFFGSLAGLTGGAYDAAALRRIHDAWLIEEYPGVGALVGRLRGIAGLRTALLSNTNHTHFARHAGPGADFPTIGLLDERFASHLLGVAKPDPAIFRRFEALTGASGAEIVFFEDTPENVEAARAAGWNAVLIDHAGDTAGQMIATLESLGVLRAGA
jgi:putative hydrolase of the HAD superfamily